MKFSCDRCGKKYATAETPAPGRVYKLKCKACGHLIVVKTPSSASAPSLANEPASAKAPSAAAEPSPAPPEVDIEVEQSVALNTPVPTRTAEPTAEISMLTAMGDPSTAPGEGGYVDIFADSPTASPPPAAPDDPFLKAARGSLPDHFGGTPPLSDPFADMRDELGEPSASPQRPSPPPRAQQPLPASPPTRRPEEKKKGGLPVALIGIGFAAIIAIVVVVALKSSKRPEPTPAPPVPVAVLTPPTPPPELVKVAPAPVAQPAATPEPKPRREEKRVVKLEPRPPPKPEPRVEPKPKPPPPPPPPRQETVARVEPEKPVQLPDAASALSPEAVQRVVNSSRRAFESCIESAARRGTETTFDGRKVGLRLNVNPNGFVTYPTLDDVTLNRTDLGECLKAAARLMVFPKFQGDPFHVEVPLTLRAGR